MTESPASTARLVSTSHAVIGSPESLRVRPQPAAALSALLAGVLSLVAQSAMRAEDWPQWRGVRGDGSWNAPALPMKWPEGGPPVVWESPIGAGYSGIAVVGQNVYTMDRPKEPADHERVVCLDLTTGKQRWQHVYPAAYGKLDYGKGPRTTPTVHAGRVYSIGAVGHVTCLDANDGRLIWKKDLVGDFKTNLATWGFSGSVVIHGDLAIVHAGAPGACYIAFDKATGDERWRGGADPLGYGTPVLVKRNDHTQLIGWTPENIVSLDADTGRENWRHPYKVTYGVSIATPIVRDDIVLVCGYWEGSKAIKLGARPADSQLLWEENKWLRGLMSQPLYRDGHVYLLDKQHGLVCFKLQTGEMVWTDKNQLTPRDRNPQANLVWLGDTDRVIALNASGELILARLSPTGYEEHSRAKIIGETWAHPAFAASFALARDDNRIVCVRVTQ